MICSDNITRCQVIIDNPANRKQLLEMRRYDLEADKLGEKENQGCSTLLSFGCVGWVSPKCHTPMQTAVG